MQTHKYKPGDYIVVTGKASPKLIGKTVRIHAIYGEHYMIDLMLDILTAYPVWCQKQCEANSHLDTTMVILYAQS